MTLSKLSDDFNNLKVLFERTRFTENQRKQLNHMEGIIFKLSYKLINITELFTEVCIPYKLWDVCLLLLHASKTEDEELVIRLWRSIIYR